MLEIGFIASIIGLFFVGLALYFALRALGYFQYLGGKKRSTIPPISKGELIDKLLALNNPSKPYKIVKGSDSDLVAEWKIVDTQWYGIFNKSGLKKSYRITLLLDEVRKSVRCYEELGEISWSAGLDGPVPRVSYSKSFFRGRIFYSKEHAIGYGIKQLRPLEAGKIYDYKFDVNEIRGPIILTVEENGWEWVPVTAKRHVISRS